MSNLTNTTHTRTTKCTAIGRSRRVTGDRRKVLECFGDVTGKCSQVSSGNPRKEHAIVENSISGNSRCIVCGLCGFGCPTDCIFVGRNFLLGAFRFAASSNFSWTLDRKRCVYCGNCVGVCPTVAISQSCWSLSSLRSLAEVLTESARFTPQKYTLWCFLLNRKCVSFRKHHVWPVFPEVPTLRVDEKGNTHLKFT
jgi:NAD-dependent dihydropyrimidine dehydrogenase PreA subunit